MSGSLSARMQVSGTIPIFHTGAYKSAISSIGYLKYATVGASVFIGPSDHALEHKEHRSRDKRYKPEQFVKLLRKIEVQATNGKTIAPISEYGKTLPGREPSMEL